jgi:hypothetical protein
MAGKCREVKNILNVFYNKEMTKEKKVKANIGIIKD